MWHSRLIFFEVIIHNFFCFSPLCKNGMTSELYQLALWAMQIMLMYYHIYIVQFPCYSCRMTIDEALDHPWLNVSILCGYKSPLPWLHIHIAMVTCLYCHGYMSILHGYTSKLPWLHVLIAMVTAAALFVHYNVLLYSTKHGCYSVQMCRHSNYRVITHTSVVMETMSTKVYL